MRKYPYYLYVQKTTFNVGPDIKRAIRRAKPEETDWYMKTQVADVGGYGPKLFEYSLKKRWPDNKKERKRIRLGRILELNNGTSILFHKTSSWRIEFLDVSGRIVDRCKRNDSYETKLLKIKLFIEKSYPHYRESNVADRIAATILSGFGEVWLEFGLNFTRSVKIIYFLYVRVMKCQLCFGIYKIELLFTMRNSHISQTKTVAFVIQYSPAIPLTGNISKREV